jgi:hypothetical protein
MASGIGRVPPVGPKSSPLTAQLRTPDLRIYGVPALEWFPPFPKYFFIQVSPNDLSVATHCVYATAIVAAPRVFDPAPLDTLFDQSLTNIRLGRIGGQAV